MPDRPSRWLLCTGAQQGLTRGDHPSGHLHEVCSVTAATIWIGRTANHHVGDLSCGDEPALTVTLRALERDGLLSRTVYPEVPPRVLYELTDLGRSLLSVVLGMAHWVRQHQDEIDSHRQRFDHEDTNP